MPNIINAPHGAGKTAYVYARMRELATLGMPCTLIVPEQQHLETEQDMYRFLGARLIGGVRITTFTKLAGDIIRVYGQPKPYADDAVKSVIMRKALLDGAKSPTSPGSAAKPADPEDMLRRYAAVKREGVSTQQILHAAEQAKAANRNLSRKLTHLGRAFKAYEEMLITQTEMGDILRDREIAGALAKQHSVLADEYIFIDGFDGFTGSQLLLLSSFATAHMYITLSMEKSDGSETASTPAAPYRYTALTAEKIARKLRHAGQTAYIPIDAAGRHPALTTVTAADAYGEAAFIAAKIRQLITVEGYACKDIAVLCADETAALPVISALKDYRVSAFRDLPATVGEKPLVRFILAALDAATLDTQAILRFVKSDFARIGTSLIAKKTAIAFERAVLARGTYISLTSPFAPGIAEDLRRQLIPLLSQFGASLKNSTGDRMTMNLASFILEDMKLESTVFSIVNGRGAGEKSGFSIDREKNDEYRQLWDIVIGIFESVYTALKGMSISPGDYRALLSGIFDKTAIARPPRVMDAVTVGDVKRTRAKGIKIAFIAGAVRGHFPAETKGGGFSASECDALLRMGLEITETRDEQFELQRFLAHKALRCAEDAVYLCASYKDVNYKPTQPAALFGAPESHGYNVIERLRAEDMPPEFYASTAAAARQLNAMNGFIGTKKAALPTHEHQISPNDALRLLYRKKLSPTAIEMMNGCAFAYFIRYGLKIEEHDEQDGGAMDPRALGSCLHFCMQRGLSDPDYCGKSSVKAYLDEYKHTDPLLQADSPRKNRLLYARIPDIVRLIDQTKTDLAEGGFTVKALEQTFECRLGDCVVAGRADRVDITADGAVRVIDYKSGHIVYRQADIDYGIGLQLLLYLYGVCDKEGASPAGAYYQPGAPGKFGCEEPILSLDIPESAAEKQWRKNHKLSGQDFTADPALYNLLREKITDLLAAKLTQVYGGHLPAAPVPGKCDYCICKGFCVPKRDAL
jgi:ATP-dependent helicase/nuclease subunit B